ncbi:hypothetical protein [Streptomyces lichenis]|uniref:Uncharacterized protein n=1 Tax=Streptomyces lichenis TaxID=2306967 RepID=A0ABT0I8S4_9ACTN|nr:hypothetical protein [Streptomyces lichenis]MCK8677728.1 hypothetical protein [Streptomyces lichenis]
MRLRTTTTAALAAAAGVLLGMGAGVAAAAVPEHGTAPATGRVAGAGDAHRGDGVALVRHDALTPSSVVDYVLGTDGG